MTARVLADGSMFLVVTGRTVAPATSAAPEVSQGLVIQQSPVKGTPIESLVAPPLDLLAFADLSRAALLKPVCIPLALTAISPYRVTCRVQDHPIAVRTAQRFLAAMAADPHPACPAGSLPPMKGIST
jgi:hypothetical protein